MNIKKVFIVSRGLPSINSPLNGIFEYDQAKALKAYGHEIVFIALDFRSIFRFRRFGFFTSKKDNINVFNISFPLGNIEHPILNYVARKITELGTVILKKKFGKPDIIHAHFALISSLAVSIKNILNSTLIITEHNSSLNSETIEPKLYAAAKYAYNNADLVLTVSSSLKQSLLKHFNVNAIEVPNIIDSNVFKLEKRKTRQDNSFVFISVGTLSHRKGMDILLSAFSNCKFPSNIKLKLIGEGELYNSLKQFTDINKLENTVEFLGYRSREEIAEEFMKSDVFVLPSRRETFGLVYVEAMFTGLPIIATPCGGPEDFVDVNNGLLIEIDNVQELSKGMHYMLKNYHLYDNLKISNDAINRFSPQIISEKISKIYDKKL